MLLIDKGNGNKPIIDSTNIRKLNDDRISNITKKQLEVQKQ